MTMPLHIALLELKIYLSSRAELAFGVALPIALFALMYFAFGGETAFSANAYVVDLDGGARSAEFVRRLDALDEITVRSRTLDDARAELDRSAITMAVVIPAGFGAAMDGGGTASLRFMQRGNGGEAGQIVASIARGAAQDMAGGVQSGRMAARAASAFGVAESETAAAVRTSLVRAQTQPPVVVRTRRVGEGGDSPTALDRLVPGMIVMFMLFTVSLGSQSVVDERRLGTLERLMTTRIGVGGLFFGKFLSGVLRALVQAALFLTLAFAVLRVGGVAEYANLFAFCALVAACASAVGLLISALARTRDQAAWAAVVFTMSMTIFGGTFFDVSEGALSTIAAFTITSYAVDSMSAMLAAGESLAGQGTGAAVLAGVAIAALIAARLLFRVSEGGR